MFLGAANIALRVRLASRFKYPLSRTFVPSCLIYPRYSTHAHNQKKGSSQKPVMGKNNKKSRSTPPGEEYLLIPTHPDLAALSTSESSTTGVIPTIVDTHTHLISTFEAYRKAYKPGKFENVWDFARGLYDGRGVEAIVDVWCDAPVQKVIWKELADSALSEEDRKTKWGGLEYWFVMGWGEIGLDYHYDNSPREVQREVFIRQLRQAVRLGKPLTIHTREAEEDAERILKEEVPKDHRLHIHCFTDSPEWAARMLDHFPNLYIGITGVITYSTNLNTSAVIQQMANSAHPNPSDPSLRIVLETDAPYMTPSNLYNFLTEIKSRRLPICHTAMIPWTAEFVANVAAGPEKGDQKASEGIWTTDRILRIGRENAKKMYGV